jgi:diguanylate cyclase (GGDEF)-like protein/PAS domain S-box-containing protein
LSAVESILRPASINKKSSARAIRGAYGIGADRLAFFGLAAVLVLLAGFAVWGALTTYRAGTAAKHFEELSDAFDAARAAIASEESLERKYRLEPSAEVRQRHRAAGGELLVQLARVRASADPGDDALIDKVQVLHKDYLLAIDHMFAAVDAGDTALATKIDGAEVDPRFDAMQELVVAAADSHHVVAFQRLDELAHVQSSVLAATPLVFAIGIALVLFFSRVLRAHRRREAQAMIHEAMAVSRSEKRFRALVQNASDVVLICAADGTITYQSPTAETIWGYAAGDLVGKAFLAGVHTDDQPAFAELFEQLQAAPGSTRGVELRLRDAVGDWDYVELILTNLLDDPDVTGVVATARDIAQRKAFEAQLIQQAFHDPLTQLPNRALFVDRLAQAHVRAARWQGSVGVLFIDLDNFKLINDSLGHQAGDTLLIEAAKRLQACVRHEDTVGRLGGDEFVVLMELATELDAVQAAERIEQNFRRPFKIDDREFVVTVSIGIALGDASQGKPDILLRNADVAMYHAKTDGKARHVIFRASMQTDSLVRLTLENDLRQAIRRDELVVYYQPIVILESGEVSEVEALVRWRHPTRGLLLPAEFIAVAEETGLIVPIGQWVLEEACRQIVVWRAELSDQAVLMVSVNLSPRQFQQPNLVGQVARALREAGLAPAWLKLEITEGVIMQDVEATIKTLWQLKELGVQLAIDDFGTGYSSLAYLKRLPIDILKIDRAFINGIGQGSEDTAIVRAIIAMGKSLHLSIIGEGIETAEQAALLREWACDRGQGYFFGRPLDNVSLAALLRKTHGIIDPAEAA